MLRVVEDMKEAGLPQRLVGGVDVVVGTAAGLTDMDEIAGPEIAENQLEQLRSQFDKTVRRAGTRHGRHRAGQRSGSGGG